MRKTFINYSITILFLLISTFVVSLILTSLVYFNVINNNLYLILSNIISIILFLLSGVFLGLKSEKKGLVKGLVFGILYLSIALIVKFTIIKDTLEIQSALNILLRFIVLPIGSIIGVNLK